MNCRLSELGWRLLPGTVTALAVALLFKLGVWQPLEQLAYSGLFRLRGEIPWDERVVLVAIDDASLKELGRFPWSRQRYVQLLNVLSQAESSVVAFDMLWSESSVDDPALAAAMQDQGQVVLAEAWDVTGNVLQPVSTLQAAAIATGHIVRSDSSHGLTRWIDLQLKGKPALGVAAVRAYELVQAPVSLPDLTHPLWLNWPGPAQKLPHYSFAQVIKGQVPPEAFKDKLVLVGTTAIGLDPLITPFDHHSSANGVHLHAAVISNLLQNNALQVAAKEWLGFILLAGPCLSWMLSRRRLELQLFSCLGFCLGWGTVCLLLLWAHHWFPVVLPMGLVVGTTTTVAICDRLRMNVLLQRQIEQIWQAYYSDLVIQNPEAMTFASLPQPSVSMQREVQLAALAEQFGRSQSAQAAIARSLSMGLLATDLNSRVWFCNPVATEWLTIQVGELLAPRLVPTWLSAAEWQADLAHVKRHRSSHSRKLQLDDRWFELKLEPLLNQPLAAAATLPTPQLDGVLVLINDITDRQEVERMKNEFVSVVSHELRTPLTSIRGSLGLLMTGKLGTLSEKGQRMLEIATTNTDRLLRLINDILDLERIESGKITLSKQACNIDSLVEQAAEVMQAMADKAGVKLDTSSIQVTFWADPDRLLQVLTNLLSNAIKFSSPGTTIRLTAELKLEDGSKTSAFNVPLGQDKQPHQLMLISVQDQGRGIPAEKLEAVFGRFQQVEASDANKKGGTGLGLAISQSIVQQHGGRIWVESTVGEGSTFYLTIPVTEVTIESS